MQLGYKGHAGSEQGGAIRKKEGKKQGGSGQEVKKQEENSRASGEQGTNRHQITD